jgi:hypothetical protein
MHALKMDCPESGMKKASDMQTNAGFSCQIQGNPFSKHAWEERESACHDGAPFT